MPELPEVQTIVLTLRRRIVGARIEAVQVRRPDIVSPLTVNLPAALAGRIIRAIGRRGKRIILDLDDGHHLCVHLGMSGRLTVEKCDAPVPPHTHLVIGFRVPGFGFREEASSSPHALAPIPELRFTDPRRFGGVWLYRPGEPVDAGLGPEPLDLPAGKLAQRLSRTRRAIKTALLDQSLIAGLGNIYADESLFEAAIDPRTPANRLNAAQVRRLSRAIKLILRRAIRHRGSTLRDYVDADGGAGAFQKLHRVYGRGGLSCSLCGAPIKWIVLGGRSTHFCPKCQRRA